MRRTVFKARQEVFAATNNALRQFDGQFWKDGFNKLIQRYKKCVELSGGYVERASACRACSDVTLSASGNSTYGESD